jgi:hypothetical protein
LTPSEIAHGEVHEPPKYYNSKVVCVKAGTDHWTVGKIYEVKDGIVYSDHGWKHPRWGEPYKDENDIRHIGGVPTEGNMRHNPKNEFIPIVEDKNEPLTTEELMKMDGQKVYCIPLNSNKVEIEVGCCGGWHTVNLKSKQLVREDGCYYRIRCNGEPYGFLAYRTAPRK